MGDRSRTGISLTSEIDSPWFNAFWSLYLLFKSWQFGAGSSIPLLDAYLADLLAMPVIVPMVNACVRRFARPSFRPTGRMLVLTWIYIVLVFEVIAPRLFAHQHADPWDAVAYGLGGFLYYVLIAPVSRRLEAPADLHHW